MKLDKKEVKKNVEELGLEFDFEMDKISEIYDIVTIGNQILRNENKDVDIEDPYRGSWPETYMECLRQIDVCLNKLIKIIE